MNKLEWLTRAPHSVVGKRSDAVDTGNGVMSLDGLRAQMLDVWSHKHSAPPAWLASADALQEHLSQILGDVFAAGAKTDGATAQFGSAAGSSTHAEAAIFALGDSPSHSETLPQATPFELVNWEVPFALG